MQERALPRPRRAHDRRELPVWKRERDILERAYSVLTLAVDPLEVHGLDGDAGSVLHAQSIDPDGSRTVNPNPSFPIQLPGSYAETPASSGWGLTQAVSTGATANARKAVGGLVAPARAPASGDPTICPI